MYQSSEQFLTNVFVIVVNSYYKKSTYLFCLLNNERDQLLMACSLITFENYTYLSNEHQLAAISQLFFLSFFCLAVNLICMLDFNETQEKKNKTTDHCSKWAIHFKSVIRMLPSLLLRTYMIFFFKWSIIKNNLSAEKVLHFDYISRHCHLFKTMLTGIP